MFRRTILAATAAVLVSGVAVSPGRAQSQPQNQGQGQGAITIATVGPMTGSNASFGAQMKAGAEMAVADINKAGGVLGKQVSLQIGDDACDPKQAVSVANQMASRKVVFVAGHFCSSSSIPANKVYADEGILQISPASTNPKLTDEGGWNTFRTCGRDDQQGEVAGKYLASHYGKQKIAIMHDNSAYGKGLADETKKTLNAAKVTEALYTAYTPGERDYASLVSRLKQANIEVIYIGGYHTETGLIMRQAQEQGMKVTVIGGDALATNEFWQIAGPAGEGAMMTFPSDPRKRPVAQKVVAEFKAKGFDPEGYTLYTYAAIQAWAAGVKKAGTTDPKKVAAVMRNNFKVDTVLGPIGFDKKGDVLVSDYVFYVWKNGAYLEM
ncbi:MAG: branched-chain amino acid ABC transporter substrate-binding protein [Janthinobacterium lividum]